MIWFLLWTLSSVMAQESVSCPKGTLAQIENYSSALPDTTAIYDGYRLSQYRGQLARNVYKVSVGIPACNKLVSLPAPLKEDTKYAVGYNFSNSKYEFFELGKECKVKTLRGSIGPVDFGKGENATHLVFHFENPHANGNTTSSVLLYDAKNDKAYPICVDEQADCRDPVFLPNGEVAFVKQAKTQTPSGSQFGSKQILCVVKVDLGSSAKMPFEGKQKAK